MKVFFVIFSALILSTAEASTWIQINCSNSDGSVKWQSGNQEDVIDLKYSNFIEGILTLELDQVNIAFLKTTTIKEKMVKTCDKSVQGKVFAAEVKITASNKYPHSLRSYFPENKVSAEVICTQIKTKEHSCN